MKQPEGLSENGSDQKVCKLLKSLYGLKQSGRSWYETLNSKLLEGGMQKCKAEPCIYTKTTKSGISIILVYVDDLILVSSNEESMKMLKTLLRHYFEMKDMGELKYILGIEVKRSDDGVISLNQRKYLRQRNFD